MVLYNEDVLCDVSCSIYLRAILCVRKPSVCAFFSSSDSFVLVLKVVN